MNNELLEFFKFIISTLAPLAAGYYGVQVGFKQIRIQTRLDFVEKQLSEFYSPLLGLHKEIRAKSELRVKVQKTGHEVWKKMSDEERIRSMGQVEEEIAYDNRQLNEESLPRYREMLDIFRTKYWLAEPETRAHYSDLVEYVEGWNRWKAKGVSSDVLQAIGHTEAKLKHFYEELEKRNDILRSELAGNK